MKNNIFLLCFLLIVFPSFHQCQECTQTTMMVYDCTHLSLTEVPREKFEQVFKMDLSFNKITALRNNTFQDRGLADLGILYLQDNQITSIHVNAFRGMVDLDFLNLNNNNIEDIPVDLFHWNRKLRFLRFENNTRLRLPEVGFHLPELNILDLEQCGLETIPPNFFANMRDLEKLYLRRNKLSSLDPELIRPLIELEFLDLRDNLFTKLQVNILRLPLVFETSYAGNPLKCDCSLVRVYSLYKKKAISEHLQCNDEDKIITSVTKFKTGVNCSSSTPNETDYNSSLPVVIDLDHTNTKQNNWPRKSCYGQSGKSWFANNQGWFITIIIVIISLLVVITGLIIFRQKNMTGYLSSNSFRILKSEYKNRDNESLDGNEAI